MLLSKRREGRCHSTTTASLAAQQLAAPLGRWLLFLLLLFLLLFVLVQASNLLGHLLLENLPLCLDHLFFRPQLLLLILNEPSHVDLEILGVTRLLQIGRRLPNLCSRALHKVVEGFLFGLQHIHRRVDRALLRLQGRLVLEDQRKRLVQFPLRALHLFAARRGRRLDVFDVLLSAPQGLLLLLEALQLCLQQRFLRGEQRLRLPVGLLLGAGAAADAVVGVGGRRSVRQKGARGVHAADLSVQRRGEGSAVLEHDISDAQDDVLPDIHEVVQGDAFGVATHPDHRRMSADVSKSAMPMLLWIKILVVFDECSDVFQDALDLVQVAEADRQLHQDPSIRHSRCVDDLLRHQEGIRNVQRPTVPTHDASVVRTHRLHPAIHVAIGRLYPISKSEGLRQVDGQAANEIHEQAF
mmetsp:Transcript_95289/g.307126  ORF Transcript_95289/g.307126 Transcript_95289/m.307126 type:complete len:411 (+) Transcript_95289:5-1237(+)